MTDRSDAGGEGKGEINAREINVRGQQLSQHRVRQWSLQRHQRSLKEVHFDVCVVLLVEELEALLQVGQVLVLAPRINDQVDVILLPSSQTRRR